MPPARFRGSAVCKNFLLFTRMLAFGDWLRFRDFLFIFIAIYGFPDPAIVLLITLFKSTFSLTFSAEMSWVIWVEYLLCITKSGFDGFGVISWYIGLESICSFDLEYIWSKTLFLTISASEAELRSLLKKSTFFSILCLNSSKFLCSSSNLPLQIKLIYLQGCTCLIRHLCHFPVASDWTWFPISSGRASLVHLHVDSKWF